MSGTLNKAPAEPLVALTRAEAITRLLAALPICETDVRGYVAQSVNTSVEVLMVLAKDQVFGVRGHAKTARKVVVQTFSAWTPSW